MVSRLSAVHQERDEHIEEQDRGRHSAEHAARGPLEEAEQPLAGLLRDVGHRTAQRVRGDGRVDERHPVQHVVDEAQRLIAKGRQVGLPDPVRDSLDHHGDLNNGQVDEHAKRHHDRTDGRQQGQRRRQPGAEPPVDPIEHRCEQVGPHRGHHDENEVAAQEIGAERDGDGGRDGQGTLLGQRELGIHCGHWHTVARLRRRSARSVSEPVSLLRPGWRVGV